MPLIHSASKKARRENIRRELEAGRPPRQAVAIGYEEQRRARTHNPGRKKDQKMENVEHGPGRIPVEHGERQRHQMGEGRGPMKGGDFGVSTYPGRETVGGHGDHMHHDAIVLSDSQRAGPPGLHMGDGSMAATAHSRHGPHGHDHGHHHVAPEGHRPHHVGEAPKRKRGRPRAA